MKKEVDVVLADGTLMSVEMDISPITVAAAVVAETTDMSYDDALMLPAATLMRLHAKALEAMMEAGL